MAGEEQTVQESPSLGDSLADAMEKVESGEGAASTPAAPFEPVELTAPPQAESRSRGKDGKFTRQATSDTPAHVTAPAATSEAPGEAPAAPQEDAPPPRWNGIKERWGSIEPEVRAEIRQREREVEVLLQRSAETRKFGESIQKEVAPYMEMLQAEGATANDAVRVLLETAYTLRHGSPEHKKAVMLSLIQQYGVDFSQGVDHDRANLERQLDLRNTEDRRTAAQERQEIQQQALDEVSAFAAQPGHEHMETLKPYMIVLLREGAAKTLQQAYETAAWAHPQVRPHMQQADNMRRQQEFSRNRNAAATVTGNPGSVSTTRTADPKNLRATLEEAFGGGRV